MSSKTWQRAAAVALCLGLSTAPALAQPGPKGAQDGGMMGWHGKMCHGPMHQMGSRGKGYGSGMHRGPGMHQGKGRHGGGSMLRREEPYTPDELKILVAAKLLRTAPATLTVGEARDVKTGVEVDIVTREGGVLVDKVVLDPETGRPPRTCARGDGKPRGMGMTGRGKGRGPGAAAQTPAPMEGAEDGEEAAPVED